MSCNTAPRPQVPLKPYIFWKLTMSAIQIRTKIQIQRQTHRQIHRQIQRQRQIKGKPMTPMMWYIFEKEMTKAFWLWYATGRVYKYADYAEYAECAECAEYAEYEVQSPISPFNLADLFSPKIWPSYLKNAIRGGRLTEYALNLFQFYFIPVILGFAQR